jgi:acetyl-CoA carboxylase carboxyltransferase component
MAVHGRELERSRQEGRPLDSATAASIEQMRADYDRDLDATHAAARGHVDAIVTPEETRGVIAFLLQVTARNPGPHLGPFVLPATIP